MPPAQDALGARAGHRRQGEDAADRLGVLHGPPQEDADGPEDRPDTRPAAGHVLAGGRRLGCVPAVDARRYRNFSRLRCVTTCYSVSGPVRGRLSSSFIRA